MEVKPLQPLNGGLVVIVGGKASNFDKDILEHPRVILWNSQDERWIGKDLPANTRAVFFTKWISHPAWNTIVRDARKRNITVFHDQSTGALAKQVRELLDISKIHPQVEVEETKMPEPVQTTPKSPKGTSKLTPLIPFIDYNVSNIANAKVLLDKAKVFGIDTTRDSLSVWVGKLRRNLGLKTSQTKPKSAPRKPAEADASVQMFDNIIQEFKDMRQFFIETVAENARLRGRLDKFRKMFED